MQTYTVGGQVVKLCVTDEVSPYPAAAAAVVTIETRRLASSTVNSIIITSSSSSSSRIQTLAFYSCRCLTNRVSRRPFQSRVPRLDRAQVVCFLRRIQIARAEKKKNPEWIWKNILFFLKKGTPCPELFLRRRTNSSRRVKPILRPSRNDNHDNNHNDIVYATHTLSFVE